MLPGRRGDFLWRCLGGVPGLRRCGMYESISGAIPLDTGRAGRAGDALRGEYPLRLDGLVSRGSYLSLLLERLNLLLSPKFLSLQSEGDGLRVRLRLVNLAGDDSLEVKAESPG